MIENSQVTIESDGEWVQVRYIEDDRLREGPATFPAHYASFAAILQYIDTNFNFKTADLTKRVEIQNLLGAPWPRGKVRIHWKDSPERDKPCANLRSQIADLQSQLAASEEKRSNLLSCLHQAEDALKEEQEENREERAKRGELSARKSTLSQFETRGGKHSSGPGNS